MAITIDLDITGANYLEFYIQFGCHSNKRETQFTEMEASYNKGEKSEEDWNRQNDILIQYSDNGGILWRYLYEVIYIYI